jgi:hypothetical protein
MWVGGKCHVPALVTPDKETRYPPYRRLSGPLGRSGRVRKTPLSPGYDPGDPTSRFCGKETETVQHIICCCEALARQRYNVFGSLQAVPTDIHTASVRDLCLLIRGTELQILS